MFLCCLACSSPQLILIPSRSSLSFPFHFRRNQDFYISSILNWNCPSSFVLRYQWLIHNCSTTSCTNAFRLESILLTNWSDLFLPGQTLLLGVYRLQLIVTLNVSANVFIKRESIYVRVTPSDIRANLVPLGTSMISRGAEQTLQLNPGNHSIDLDGKTFNASVNDLLPFVADDSLMNIALGLDLYVLVSNLFHFQSFSAVSLIV